MVSKGTSTITGINIDGQPLLGDGFRNERGDGEKDVME